jgi:H+-translocating NAD(P) transhydrogenase subunit beta
MVLSTGTTLAYLFAAALFIFGIRLLRSPQTARAGNVVAAFGMFVAFLVTFFEFPADLPTLGLLAAVLVLGSVIGAVTAVRVPMTSMPQFVAAFNGVGGGAAALIAFSELYELNQHGDANPVIVIMIFLAILIGGISFSGSVIAFVKLEEIALGGSVTFPGQKALNALLFVVALAAGINVLVGGPAPVAFAAGALAIALLLGVLLVIPIGGADMPIVISLLNAFTGLAAAASGFALGNVVLIIAGALVGASGTILTYLMSGALGRPLSKILFGAVAGAGTGAALGSGEEKPVTSGGPEDVAATLAYDADSVIFIPGYGLAVAQAQGAMADLMRTLEAQGKDVKFAIHPVAGRMPGHMNVLLAEAEVPADKMYDLEDINDQFAETDAVVIVGANDVVNPSAREDGDSPIAGMPILNADHARRVVIVKRSLSPGFAGIDNPLFYEQDKTTMLFSDAKQGLEGITQSVKNQG